jgi:hypothetical protein
MRVNYPYDKDQMVLLFCYCQRESQSIYVNSKANVEAKRNME